MADIKKLNEAIKTLKNECKRHLNCDGCPLFDDVKLRCQLNYDSICPQSWKLIEDGDSDD